MCTSSPTLCTSKTRSWIKKYRKSVTIIELCMYRKIKVIFLWVVTFLTFLSSLKWTGIFTRMTLKAKHVLSASFVCLYIQHETALIISSHCLYHTPTKISRQNIKGRNTLINVCFLVEQIETNTNSIHFFLQNVTNLLIFRI